MNRFITAPRNCTGCALCANVCAHDAINMVWNADGFLVPQVDATRCINCGACVNACPAQPEHLEKLRAETGNPPEPPVAYGGWHKDKSTHLSSSSGGILSALAQHTFKAGGCVFGVVWSSKDTAEYTKAENMAELAAMRGSKYTQALPGTVYRKVKAELKKGRQVLFCGTSCQVYALKRYLRKEYAKLLLVDILCHGVPSRHLLQSYIRGFEKATGKTIDHIQFRHKAGNWQQYHVKKCFTDGSSVSHKNWDDTFIRLFVGDFALNEACYNCPHARFPRVGDITLGDFWGELQQLHPEWPIADGIGSILGNSAKGKRLLMELSNAQYIELKSVSLEEQIHGQRETYIRRQPQLPQLRRYALTMLKQQRLSVLCHKLFDCEQCGPFRLRKGCILNKLYKKARRIRHRITDWIS